jgi:hypothetical protein
MSDFIRFISQAMPLVWLLVAVVLGIFEASTVQWWPYGSPWARWRRSCRPRWAGRFGCS